jgi:hypothetical protein
MESPKNKDRKQAQKAKQFILPQNASACQIFPKDFRRTGHKRVIFIRMKAV